MKQMIYMWQMNPQAKKAGWGVEELTAKQKQITVGRRLWGSCRGWRCPRARPWTNQIVTESKIGQMLCWNKLGMFDYLTFLQWYLIWHGHLLKNEQSYKNHSKCSSTIQTSDFVILHYDFYFSPKIMQVLKLCRRIFFWSSMMRILLMFQAYWSQGSVRRNSKIKFQIWLQVYLE